MIYRGTRVRPATAQHAVKYLRAAESLAAAGQTTSYEALDSIGRSIHVPCRAVGVAKVALHSAKGDLQAAIDLLKDYVCE